jgi:GT2 family glycosyltransferase
MTSGEAREATGPAVGRSPIVSVVIPCLDEARFIGPCLESIVTNQFPSDRLDVIVVDGGSKDGTAEILATYAARHPFVRVARNPARITPVAFNIGIRQARGDLIMLMSAHATLGEGAIAKAVAFSRSSGAENVGGRWEVVPRGQSLLDLGIAAALSHWFGVGNATYRTGTTREPRWVDTAAYGCYRREVFTRIGVFNERLVRGQDMEFNLRLKRAGGRTLFVPDIVVRYYARSDVRSFVRHSFVNGAWAVLPFAYSDGVPVSARHLTPMMFVLGVGVSLAAGLASLGWWPLLLVGGSYVVADLVASVDVARRRGRAGLGFVLPFLFSALHTAYGLGSAWGAVRALVALARGRSRPSVSVRAT